MHYLWNQSQRQPGGNESGSLHFISTGGIQSMKLKEKILSALTLTVATASAISVINKIIFAKSESHVFSSSFPSNLSLTYHWRFGQIRYKKCGEGRPILLIHSIDPSMNSYEWKKIVAPLSQNHTVYTVDLIGCGFSEKPGFLYTNFLYVQLISDFVKDVIGRRTDVIGSGNASSVILMACRNNDSLFDQITMINPESIGETMQVPTSRRKLSRFFYNLPIIGTLGYNIAFSRQMLKERYLGSDLTSSKARITNDDLEHFYHNAHIGGYRCKMLYSSLRGKYMNMNVSNALRDINNNILIVGGGRVDHISDICREYQQINPAVETCILEHAGNLLALEAPERLMNILIS